MKKMRWMMAVLLAGSGLAWGEVTPDELIRAVDQMSPEQVQTLRQKLDAKTWKPIPEGFFSRLAVDLGIGSAALDSIDLSGVSLSGGNLDIDMVSGLDLGLLWRVGAGDRFRLGLRLGGWEGTDSNLGAGGYSSADLTGGYLALAAQYQWIRTASCLVWTELAPGVGGVALDTVDTPSGQPTTLRSFEGTYGQMDILAGASWRVNPILAVYLSGGYRLAESVDLDEGGQTSAVEFDASGFVSRLGLGFNF